MGKSDTVLLRSELKKLQKNLGFIRKKTDKTINEYKNKLAQRDVRIDLLELALADRDRRLAFYKNPNTSYSTNSMYNAGVMHLGNG